MTRKLNEADRAAVDMLFDRIATAGHNGGGGNGNGGNGGDSYVPMTVAVAEDRLSAVERILSTLQAMPAPEPSADLAVRTLQRVARATATVPTMQPPAPGPFIDPTQPMA